MKRLVLLAFVVTASLVASAQLTPVTWSFSAVKTGDKTYEIHMKATIQDRWHLYSQSQPDDAVAMPTTFSFNANPLVEKDGKVKEVGKMEKFKDKQLGLSANQYSEKVDFVQVVKLKGAAKTSVSGSVEFQTCDDKKCLPPKTVNFNIALN